MPGHFISIEGLDGAGKSTATAAITDWLERAGHTVVALREPGGTELAEYLRALTKGNPLPERVDEKLAAKTRELLERITLRSERQLAEHLAHFLNTGSISPYSGELDAQEELLLFNAARAQLVEYEIKPLLTKGVTVLIDRFYDSSIAYQGYARGLGPELVEAACLEATGELSPELTFLLRIRPQTRLSRMDNRGIKHDRFETAGDRFFQQVASGFDAIAVQHTERFIVIDAEQDVQSVTESIIQALQERGGFNRAG